MPIQRPRARRSPWPFVGCGCLGVIVTGVVLVVIAALLLLPALPRLALQVAGFSPQGSTSAVFAGEAAPPPIQVQNPVVPSQVVINMGSYGAQSLNPDASQVQVVTGTSGGAPLATVTFSETGLMSLCYHRSDVCASSNNQFRNAWVDLRPGGAVIYADVNVPEIGVWQPVGVVLRLDGSRRQFDIAGVDIDGALYGLPSGGLGARVEQVARTGNDILQQLALEAGGGRYALAEVQITDSSLTLVMR